MKIAGRITILMLVVFLSVLASVVFAVRQMDAMRHDGRVVNHAGIVR